MGSCLQSFFGRTRSTLRQQSLLNYNELTTIIRPSTRNDHKFYSSSNLTEMQQYLNNLKATTPISRDFINVQLIILNQFIRNLKDRESQIGKQYLEDVKNIKKYLEKNKNVVNCHQNVVVSDLVVLRVEIQLILISGDIMTLLNKQSQYELFLDIFQDQSANARKVERMQSLSVKEENQNKMELIDCIKLQRQYQKKESREKNTLENNFSNYRNSQDSRVRVQPTSPQKIKSSQRKVSSILQQNQLMELPIFSMSSAIVNKNSKITFYLYKVRKSNKIHGLTSKTSNQSPTIRTPPKSKTIISQTSLSVSDFIYYNSLLVSDVVPMSSPNSIKSSITTSASNSISFNNSNICCYLSVRGQGLQAHTIQKDYIKITKQHETVAMQLGLCLDGDRAWERLSEFKQSSEEGRGKDESMYSQYSVPQEVGNRYKI